MHKWLLLLCIISSVSFLLTQLLAFYYFDAPQKANIFNHLTKFDSLLTGVKLLQKVCIKLNVNCVLVDTDLLKKFKDQELQHRSAGLHDHNACKLFCGKFAATFAINGGELQYLVSDFKTLAKQFGFDIFVQEDYDRREESLEKRHGAYKLIYHIFLTRNQALLHIVVFYPRFNRIWSGKCDFAQIRGQYFTRYLALSIFCNRENIFKRFESVTALIDGIKVSLPKPLLSFVEETHSSTFISCNYQQARSFYSTYGYDTTYQSEMFRSKANHILATAVDILSELNIRFWLSSGTCLGWYRQCDFIPHSKDVDIGIWIKDYKENLISAFSQRGLLLKHLFGKIEDSFELSFSIDDLKLDIFFFYEDGNSMWNGGTQARTGKKFKYIFPKFTLCWTTISNLLVKVPCDTNKYILANYGETWNTMVKKWDWKASPPNVKENGEWPVHKRKKLIQMF